MTHQSLHEVQRLIDALCDRALLPDDAGRLDELLANDPLARQAYLEQVWIEAELYSISMPLDGNDAHEEWAAQSRRGEIRWFRDARLSIWLALAASMLVAATVSVWLTLQGVDGRGPLAFLRSDAEADAPATAPLDELAVAQVTGTRDCLWGAASSKVGFGTKLQPGQELELRAGLAELTFDNGVNIVLEGPSRFVVPGDRSARLIAGKISAAIPQLSEDFAIYTSRLAIADPGAQFGLIVEENGDTEVHVFEGPIYARAVDSQNRVVGRVTLAANEAARLSPASVRFTPMQPDDELFTRTLAPTAGPTEGLLAVEEFDYPAGPLAWHNGGFGWAGPWADLDLDATIDGPATNAVAEGSLATSTLVPRGNRAVQTGQWNRARRVLSTSLRGVFDAAGLIEDRDAVRLVGRDGTSVYISFLQRVTAVSDVFYGFELNRGDGNHNRVLSIGHGAEGTAYGVSSNTNGFIDPDIDYGDDRVCTPLFESLGDEDLETHLLVIRIDYGADHNDVATVYRDPVSLQDEQACRPSATLYGDFAFDRISLGNFNGEKGKVHEVDEIRVGASFRAVTGRRIVAEPEVANYGNPQPGRNCSTAALIVSSMTGGPIGSVWGSGMQLRE